MKKIIFSLCLIPCAMTAFAASDLAQVKSQLKEATAQNALIESKVKKSDAALEKTRKDLVVAANKLNNLEEERGTLKNSIAELDQRREKLLSEIGENRGRLAASAAGLIAISENQSFDTGAAREYVLTSALLTGVSDQFDAEMKIAEQQEKELAEIREQRAARQEKLDKTAKKYADDRAYLDKLVRKRSAQNESLRSQQYELQRKMKDLSDKAKNLSELARDVSRGRTTTGREYSGRKLHPPVSGRLVLGYGEKSDLGLVCDGWKISTRSDALVIAPADGKVEFSDNFRGHRRVLILSHKNGYYSVLTGLASTDVMIGQDVLAGEPVGRMPDERSEMYMELRRGSSAVDPARMFNEP